MSKTLHLRRRGGAYFWRRKVPQALLGRMSCNELVRSLQTSDPKQARLRGRLMTVASDKLFAMIEQQPILTTNQIDELLREHFEACLQTDEEQRQRATPYRSVYTQTPAGYSLSPLEADLDTLSYLLSDAVDALAGNDIRPVKVRASALAPSAVEGSPEYLHVCRGLLRLDAELLRLALARRGGDYSVLPDDPLFSATAVSQAQAAPEKQYSDPPLSEVVPKYLEWLSSQKDVSVHNVGQRKGTLRMLQEFLGEVPVDSIARADLVEFRDTMRTLPAKHGQLKGWKSLTISEKMSKVDDGDVPDDAPLLSDKRIKSQFSEVSGLFQWLVDRKEYSCDQNPVRDFKWGKGKAARHQRVAFESDELLTLFRQPLWRGSHQHFRIRSGSHIIKDSRYFLPLIALYSGMRLGEIAQLYLKDVRELDGVWYMDVNDYKDKSVKNDASVRYVPVHPELIRLGLLEHYEKMLSRGEARLWPDIKPAGPDHRYGVAPSKQFQL